MNQLVPTHIRRLWLDVVARSKRLFSYEGDPQDQAEELDFWKEANVKNMEDVEYALLSAWCAGRGEYAFSINNPQASLEVIFSHSGKLTPAERLERVLLERK